MTPAASHNDVVVTLAKPSAENSPVATSTGELVARPRRTTGAAAIAARTPARIGRLLSRRRG